MRKSISSLFKKSNCEQIALVALYKRATVSESLSISFKRATPLICNLHVFFMFLTVVIPFYAKRANRYRRSSLATLNKRATVSESLPPLFTKEQWLAICSGRSWQKSNRSDSPFFRSKRSFARSQKKLAICSKTDEQIPNPVGKKASRQNNLS